MTLPTIPLKNPSLDIRRHEIDNLVLADCFKHPLLVFVVFVNFFLFYFGSFVVSIYVFARALTMTERIDVEEGGDQCRKEKKSQTKIQSTKLAVSYKYIGLIDKHTHIH